MIIRIALLFVIAWSVGFSETAASAPLIAVNHACASRRIFRGPLFALYADGTVIVRKDWNPRIPPDEAAALCYVTFQVPNPVELARHLFPNNPAALKPRHALTRATDQNETSIWIRGHVTRIYGEWDMPARWRDLDSNTLAHERALQQSLPLGLRHLLDQIEALSKTSEAKPWIPLTADVHFTGYDYAPDATTPWPAKWQIAGFPSSTDDRFFTCSVRFPGSDLNELQGFLACLPERGAIGVRGLKVAASVVFVRFPQDYIWNRDIRIAATTYDRKQIPGLYAKGMTPKHWKEMRRLLGLDR